MSEENEVEAAPEATFVSHLDWQGVSVKVPAGLDDVDPDAIEAFENDKAITALRSIFGSDEYDRARNEFTKVNGHRPTMKDIGTLSDAVAEHFGFTSAGE